MTNIQLQLQTIEKMMRVKIVRDDDPLNPRTEWDNLGTMVCFCFHGRYNLGDEQQKISPSEYLLDLAEQYAPGIGDSIDNVIEKWHRPHYAEQQKHREYLAMVDAYMEKRINAVLDKHYVMLPLYLYDHSGITMSTGPFSCQWDSGQVGFIYITREKILAEYGGKILTKKLRERVAGYLESEVKTYDQYLTGAVYGFVTESLDNATGEWEDVDSCWGFYGEDVDGIANHVGAPTEVIKKAFNDIGEWVVYPEAE